jgi:hypothetical protein
MASEAVLEKGNVEKTSPIHDEHVNRVDSDTYKKDVEGKDVVHEEHERVRGDFKSFSWHPIIDITS